MPPHILVIDDDPGTRRFFERLSQRTPYTFHTAASGGTGLAMIREGDYALVFLDLELPDIPGTEVLRGIRSLNAGIAVYVVTGFYDAYFDELKEAAGEGIAFELLQKPVASKQIMTVIKSVFEGPQHL